MDRRNFLTTSSLAAVALATAQLSSAKAFAAGKDPKKDGTGPGNTEKLALVNKTALECFATAQACAAHCQSMLEKGDTKMAKCLADVLNMSAVVETMIKLTGGRSVDPELMKQAVSTCGSFCRACAESCKPHVSHSPVCKECKEACDRCADACDSYMKA